MYYSQLKNHLQKTYKTLKQSVTLTHWCLGVSGILFSLEKEGNSTWAKPEGMTERLSEINESQKYKHLMIPLI